MTEYEVSTSDSFKIVWNDKILMKMTFFDLLLLHVYLRPYMNNDVKCFIDSLPDDHDDVE